MVLTRCLRRTGRVCVHHMTTQLSDRRPQPSNILLGARDEEEDGQNSEKDGGVLSLINRGGFPITEEMWERMWVHARRLNPLERGAFCSIRAAQTLPQITFPHPPSQPIVNTGAYDTVERIHAVQKYISELQYNHTGTQFFEIRKNRPITGLMEMAKDMIREALPIKCLEAAILAIYLTNELQGVDRFPISFKTVFRGHVYRHVVLGLLHNGKFGALGTSRRPTLMYKPLTYSKLSQLVMDYIHAYKSYWHSVRKVKIGGRVPHDQHSYETISWKLHSFNADGESTSDLCKELDKCSRVMRNKFKHTDAVISSYLPCSIQNNTGSSHTDGMKKRQSIVYTSRSKSKKKSAKHRRLHTKRSIHCLDTTVPIIHSLDSNTYTQLAKSTDAKLDTNNYIIRI